MLGEEYLTRGTRAIGQLYRRTRRVSKVALRRYRQARVARKRGRSKKAYVLTATLAVLAAAFFWSLSYLGPSPLGRKLTLGEFSSLAAQGGLTTATFLDQNAQIVGTYVCPTSSTASTAAGSGLPLTAPTVPIPGCPVRASAPLARSRRATHRVRVLSAAGSAAHPLHHYWLAYPSNGTATPVLLQLAIDGGASVQVNPQTAKADVRMVATFLLPLMLLANLFVLAFAVGRGSSSGIGEVELFGSIGKGRGRRRRKAPVTFSDIAGADEAVTELREVRDYLANPERYQEIGAQPPKGVLLIGPPGCGKTLLAKAVAGETGVPFFSVAGAEFVESLVGVGAARVRDLFRRVRAAAPAIVFIDELDAVGRRRASGGGSGGSDEREQTLNQLLVEMDGFEISSGIVVMGATNRPDILDPALLRPGRFDRHVTIERPDVVGRVRILELHAQGRPVDSMVDFAAIARRTAGFSGADLANIVNEAALLAIRQGRAQIQVADLEEAIQRVLTGTVRKGRMLTPEERKRAAYHESGHVIVAAASGRLEDALRVSILAAGRAVGSAVTGADAEMVLRTRSQLQARLAVHLAGLAAEELVFGEPSTGAEHDLEQATDLARDLVARYGMSERLGRARLLAKDVDAFLEADVALGAVSGQTHQDVDTEIRRLLEEAEREASGLLVIHRESLDTLAARLEVEETLEGAELESLIAMVRPEVELFGTVISVNGQSAAAYEEP